MHAGGKSDPSGPDMSNSIEAALRNCVEAAREAAQACTNRAESALADPELARMLPCIAHCLDAADICRAIEAIAARPAGSNDQTLLAVLATGAIACGNSGDECARSASRYAECKTSAAASRRCEEACRAASELIRDSH